MPIVSRAATPTAARWQGVCVHVSLPVFCHKLARWPNGAPSGCNVPLGAWAQGREAHGDMALEQEEM